MRSRLLGVVIAIAIVAPSVGRAHHSFAEFDRDTVVEHAGEIVSLVWRNPLGRIGVSRDRLDVGQHVRFAGWPSTRQDYTMAVTHRLLDDEQAR